MRFLKYITGSSCWITSVIIILIGIGIIILAFMNSPLQLQIALGFIGLGFISLGLAQVKRGQDEKKLDQIIAKLDEMQQELKKEKQPERTGIAIADVITSSLKYYTEHMNKQKKEE